MDRSTLIDHYAAGGEKLSLAIRGLSREDMLVKPPADAPKEAGKWSIQQVVIHLMDADLIGADRMKRVIAEDNPQILGYDESKFVASLFYDDQSAEDAIRILDMNRRQFTTVLRKLPETAFARAGTHNERGRVTLSQLLHGYVEHLDHHLKFIHAKRAAMGKEMW